MSSVISIKNADEGIFSGGGIGVPAYRAGNGIYIKDYNISVKYDNQTTKINDDTTLGIKYNDNTLEVNSEGVSVKYDPNTLRVNENGLTADPYTSGSALKIVNRQVSVQYDNDTIKVNGNNELYVDKDTLGDDYWEIYNDNRIYPENWYSNFTCEYDPSSLLHSESTYVYDVPVKKLSYIPIYPNPMIHFHYDGRAGAIDFYIFMSSP